MGEVGFVQRCLTPVFAVKWCISMGYMVYSLRKRAARVGECLPKVTVWLNVFEE